MDFWKSNTVRRMVALVVGGIILGLKSFGVDLDVEVEKVVDAVLTIGVILVAIFQVLARLKPHKTIDRDTVPVPIKALASGGKKTATVILLAVVLTQAACSGLVRNANRSMAAFEAAYTIEEPVRAVFCKDVEPQPPICPKAQAIVKDAYASYQAFAATFALYLRLKTEEAQANLVALFPEILGATSKITALIEELK